MKKLFLILAAVVLAFHAFCFDFDKDSFSVELDLETALFVHEDRIYIAGYDGKVWSDGRPEKIVNEYGYPLLRLGKNPYWGRSAVYLFDLNGDIIRDNFFPDGKSKKAADFFKADGGVESVRASSELTEFVRGRKIVYSAENVLNLGKERETPYFFRSFGDPWVPDIKKDRNPHIDFAFTHEKTSLHILPGFVDFDRQHLWKQNARPKTIEVVDLEKSESLGTYTVRDCISFTSIDLPKPVRKARIKFLDFYTGTKYQDPCVSAVYFGSDGNPPKCDYNKSAFEENGYFIRLIEGQRK